MCHTTGSVVVGWETTVIVVGAAFVVVGAAAVAVRAAFVVVGAAAVAVRAAFVVDGAGDDNGRARNGEGEVLGRGEGGGNAADG